MVSFLQIENLSKSYGDRMLFTDITLGVYQGDKIGIIAPNGTGKSTFLKILTGKEDFDEGKITYKNDLKIGYLAQIPDFDQGINAWDFIMSGEDIELNPGVEERARKLLHQFKILDLSQKMGSMSGGQTKRIALAKALLNEPDMLILDEPTNHLDISMVEWLENFLSKSSVTLIMVTHDRYFLDKVCNKIIEIDRNRIYVYEGNYSYYIEKRDERYENLSAELAKVRNILRKELDWMRRQPQARATKSKSRIDNFYKLQEKSRLNLSQKEVNLGKGNTYIGSKIFDAHNVSKSFGETKILDDWSYTFARYEKVGIVGDNGAGKTSFIKLLLGELKPDVGFFDIGSTVKWGYYSQDGMTDFDDKKKVIDVVRDIAETIRIDDKTVLTASQFLTRFLFSPQTQQKYIHTLSGGELRRLYLATVLMKNPNFLILDEPTNDLDITTLSILEDYLADFKGCVIVVSHDRFFLDKIADHIFVFEGDGKIKDFPGNYSDYREYLKLNRTDEEGKETIKKKEIVGKIKDTEKEKKNKLTFKEKKEMEQLTEKVTVLETEKQSLEEEMSSGVLDHERLRECGERMEKLLEELDEIEFRLLELMEKED